VLAQLHHALTQHALAQASSRCTSTASRTRSTSSCWAAGPARCPWASASCAPCTHPSSCCRR
jgi:hypothetical protein